MNRQDFIKNFRMALSGQVPAYVIEENVRYYEEYIDVQVRQGKTEKEVLDSLGDPRLLAKTVITMHKTSGSSQSESGQTYESVERQEVKGSGFWNGFMRLPSWLRSILTVIIMVGIFFVIAKIIGLLLPVVLFVVIIVYLLRMFRGGK